MKKQRFEIAVAGYPCYRFKTYAQDGVEATIRIRCFLGKPDAECMILSPSFREEHVRETESCRMQVAIR